MPPSAADKKSRLWHRITFLKTIMEELLLMDLMRLFPFLALLGLLHKKPEEIQGSLFGMEFTPLGVDLITLFLGSHVHGGRGVPLEWTSVPKPEHMKLPAGQNSAELTNATDVEVAKIVVKLFIQVAPVSKLHKLDSEDQVCNIHVAQLLFGFHSPLYLYCHAFLFCHKDSPRNMHHLSTDVMEKAVFKFFDEAKKRGLEVPSAAAYEFLAGQFVEIVGNLEEWKKAVCEELETHFFGSGGKAK
ncbi:hypothetical protein BDR26DRAFT_893255 [Obelidium mucronatum]|nr:hypothetical protein BDR26DRAFT_893255 [Obelidium mucronatum]